MDDTELSVIRVRPPDCHCLPIQSKKHYVKSKSEHVLLTRTHLKALQTPKMCHCPPGYHAAVSPLTGDDAQSCRAAGGSQEALGYPQVGGRGCRLPPAPGGASEAEPGWELPAAHSAAQPGCSLSLAAPGSLTSWGALREEVPEKKQKPGCLALAVLRLQPLRLLPQSLNIVNRASQRVHLFFIKAAKCDFNLYSNDCNPEGETIWMRVGSSLYYNTVQSIGLSLSYYTS